MLLFLFFFFGVCTFVTEITYTLFCFFDVCIFITVRDMLFGVCIDIIPCGLYEQFLNTYRYTNYDSAAASSTGKETISS